MKNSLFAGSDGGGRTWATIATLLQTCRMNNVHPVACMTQTLERLANQWPGAEIDILMPWLLSLNGLGVSLTLPELSRNYRNARPGFTEMLVRELAKPAVVIGACMRRHRATEFLRFVRRKDGL